MEIKAAVFDLGGTLIDDRDMIYIATSSIFAEMNVPMPSKEDYNRNFTSNWVEIYEKHGIKANPAELIKRFNKITLDKNRLKMIKPYGGTMQALQSIKENMHIVINTSYRTNEIQAIMSTINLPKFDFVMTGDDVTKLKPNPHSINVICNELKILPSQCVMIGDTSADVLCGKNAGAKTIAVAWGTNNDRDLARLNPDAVAYSWNDVLEFLNVN